MFAIQTFSIPAATLRDLLNFAAASGKPEAATEFADLAIREWLARAKEPAVQTCRQRGYQWKNLFLPEGTQLRVWSRENGSRYAEVVGDEILHARRPITPNQFVRLQEGIPRNAWTEIWLLMPDETAWKAAHSRRDEQRRAERARDARPFLPAAAATTATAAPAPAPAAIPAPAPAATPAPAPPPRLPRIPPIPSQARIQARQGQPLWWPEGPERRTSARRQEDSFLD